MRLSTKTRKKVLLLFTVLPQKIRRSPTTQKEKCLIKFIGKSCSVKAKYSRNPPLSTVILIKGPIQEARNAAWL